MAIGKRNYATASIPGIFIDTDRVEYVLGPFWIYLIAIGLHMAAAGTMCFIGVYNRYLKFLREKTEYTKISAEANPPPRANVITVNRSDS
uniref:Uncharacterized protein n=2 Tax=Panagrolaimus TaxID=55784 RepID=A0A914QN98_9BILA